MDVLRKDEQGRDVVLAELASPPRRWGRGIVIRVVLCVGCCFAVLPFLSGKIDSERLGAVAVDVAISVLVGFEVVKWLCRRPYRLLFVGGLPVAVILLAFSVGLPMRSKTHLAAFQAAANRDFVIQAGGDSTRSESVLCHPELGIYVRVPGTSLMPQPVRQVNETCFGWRFIDESHRHFVSVSVDYCRIRSRENLQKALFETLRVFRETAAKKGTYAKVTLERQDVTWDVTSRYAEAEGRVGRNAFCLRMVPVDSARSGPHPVFAVLAISGQHSVACDVARSLRIRGTAWAGIDPNGAAR